MENPYEPPKSSVELEASSDEPVKRQGCLTAYLIFMMITNSIAGLAYVLAMGAIRESVPGISDLQIFILTFCCAANVICAFALLKYRRWGFIGFIVTSVIGLAINASLGISIVSSLFGVAGIVILYLLLNMGGNGRAWTRLK